MPMKTIFETALDEIWTADEGVSIGDKPGDIRWENNKAYKCVIFSLDGAVTVATSDVVFYDGITGYIAHTVTGDLSASNNQGAGVCMATVLLAGTRFWVQLTGVATLNTPFDGTVTPGDALTAVAAIDKSLTISALVDDFIVASGLVDADDTIICAFPF